MDYPAGLLGALTPQDQSLGLGLLGLSMLGGNYGRNKTEAFTNALQSGLGTGMQYLQFANEQGNRKKALDQRDQAMRQEQSRFDQTFGLQKQQFDAAQVERARQLALQEQLQRLRTQAGQIPGQPVSLAPTQANADAAASGTLPRRSEMDAVDFLRRNGDLQGAEALLKTLPKNTGSPISVAGPNGTPTLYQGQDYGAPKPLGMAPYEPALDPRKIPFAVQMQQALLPGEIQKANAGATRITNSVNTDRTVSGEIARIVGQQIGDEFKGAQGAVPVINNAQAIQKAIDGGRIVTGPGANARMTLLQLGATLGVNGKDDNEKLTNTRGLMQNMAQAELTAAAGMAGQGPITDRERELIKRAASGDITMTADEIKQMAAGLEKNARYRIQLNNRRVNELGKKSDMGMVPSLMSVQEPPSYNVSNW